MPGGRARSVIAHSVLWAAIATSIASCSPGRTQPLKSNVLECTGNMHDGPPQNYTVYFDAVALPAAPAYPNLGTARDPEDRSTPRWAKAPLWFRPMVPFSLQIADESRARPGMGWGYPGKPAKEVVNEPCSGAQPGWAVLPGGFWGAKDLCIAVEVRSGADRAMANIGLGVDCPG